MKFLFLTSPAYGHLNPMSGIMRELVKRNHKVIAYNTVEFADKIKQTGAVFREPPFKIGNFDLRQMNSAVNIAEKVLNLTEKAVPELTTILQKEKFDCLLHDSFNLWGKVAALKNNIPAISLIPCMAINLKVLLTYTKFLTTDYLQLVRQPLRTLQIFRGFKSIHNQTGNATPLIFDLFVNKEKLNLVFTSEHFQPCRESFDTSFKFIGPIIFDRQEEAVPDKLLNSKKPIIYVSLGTAHNDDVNSYKTLIDSFTGLPFQVFISIGSYVKPQQFNKLPKNVYIRNYLPQLEILKRSSLFISHGGMNSVNESLYFGVPLLLLPIIQEQRINSARVEELGAGIYYKNGTPDTAKLKLLLNKLLADKSYKNNAKKVGITLTKSGGLRTAVEYILNYVSQT